MSQIYPIAMVARSDNTRTDIEKLANQLALQWKTDNVKIEQQEGSSAIISFEDNSILVGSIPKPIDWESLEGPCKTAWWWEDAEEEMKKGQGHIIVSSFSGKGDILDRAISVTKVAATLATNETTLGVYWGTGTVVHSPVGFVRFSEIISRKEIPVLLWVDIRLVKTPDNQFALFSTGMKLFGKPEIEFAPSDTQPKQLMERAYKIVMHLISEDAMLASGQMIDLGGGELIQITEEKSMFGRPENVLVLSFLDKPEA